jgi:hypothetical protein
VKLKRPVSIEEAIRHLTKRRRRGAKLSDFAGLWKDMTDEEAEEMEDAINQAWKKWRSQQ